MSGQADVVVLLCTVPPERTEDFVDALLRERLIACANCIGPVQSRYVWKGNIETAAETLLVMKTSRERVPALEQRVAELHPYDVPELLVMGVDGGLEAYLGWVRESVASADERDS